MAQKVQVMVVCDVHDDEVEGAETVSFGLDGTSYEVDVCEEHAATLRDAFAPFVGAARRAGRGEQGQQKRGGRGRRSSSDGGGSGRGSGSNKERTQAIRDWARENGYKVSERGRLSGEVVAAYDAAHS